MTTSSDLSAHLRVAAGTDRATPRENGAVPVRLDALRPGFSPRISGENLDHVQALSEVEDQIPPILVHRPSMRIIDGMHRYLAAVRRGAETILAEFFGGPVDEAFLLALKRNASHGYPLTPADREAAVGRILNTHPDWSDRAIAEASGISAKTVGAIRRRLFSDDRMVPRLCRDGRTRPLDATEGRLRASRLIEQNPAAPIREIATKAGISHSTAQDVRERLRAGESPVPTRHRQKGTAMVPAPRSRFSSAPQPPADQAALVTTLQKDPSLRFSEAGRHLLRLLESNALCPMDQWEQLAANTPEHWLGAVSSLAREFAAKWHRLAEQLHSRQAMGQTQPAQGSTRARTKPARTQS